MIFYYYLNICEVEIQNTPFNFVSHTLTGRVLASPHYLVWMKVVPPHIEDFVSADLAQD